MDGGDGDGLVEPGETILVDLTFRNDGLAMAEGLTCRIQTDDPNVDLMTDSSEVSVIPPEGGVGSTVTGYEIAVHGDCPEVYEAAIEYEVLGEYTLLDTFYFTVSPGIYYDGMESTSGWSHEAVSPPTYGDEWHWSVERARSGEHSWKCGTPGGSYSNHLDAGLVSPEVTLEGECQLIFYHWMDAETVGNHNHQAYDAGLVQISEGGGPWQTMNPEGGYPYFIVGGSGHPFSGYRGYSGRHGWERASFDLSWYEGPVRFRFRFGSGETGVAEGWYIDDLLVQGSRAQDIDLEPWSYDVVLEPGGDTTMSLMVYNRGDRELEFSVEAFGEWLSVVPLGGEVGAHGSMEVSVVVDATGMEEGEYEGSLEVSSDDPDEPWLLLPVELTLGTEVCGDANGDGGVTTGDGYMILNYMGSGPQPGSCWSCNVNGDGDLTPSDGFWLLNYLGAGPGLDCAPCEFGRYGRPYPAVKPSSPSTR
jgi:hypothetical protein